MIVVDASAILAIVLKEPDADVYRERLLHAGSALMSAVNQWEVLVRAWKVFGDPGSTAAEGVLRQMSVEVVATTADDARAAASAFQRFGRGSGGPLNLGDCFAYALAMREGDGLLFKGEDFTRTDVRSALS